jgi:ABC-type sugar transport system permease subunit
MVKVRPWVPYLYCAPLLALLAFIFGYPLVKVVDFSTRLVRGSSGPFIGLDNYRNAIDDPTFRNAARHSATLLLVVPVLLVISVLVSVLLYDQMRGWRVYRSVLFLPYILAVPVVGIVASYIFTLHGVINELLQKVGLQSLAIDWIGSEHYALMTVLIVIIWREVGFGIVLFLARLMSQDDAPLEAARIDGASWWQRLWHVILPELRGTIEFYVVIAATTVLAFAFAYVWTLTQGGPGDATTTLEVYIYNTGEVQSLPGQAAAVATMLLALMIPFIVLLFWVRRRAAREAGGTTL